MDTRQRARLPDSTSQIERKHEKCLASFLANCIVSETASTVACFRAFCISAFLPICFFPKHETGLTFMHVIVLASQKGGSGKTTLTGNLAIAAELAKKGPAVLIDTDPQGSLAAWWNVRKAETPAFASATVGELKRKLDYLETAGYSLAFVDTPPA